MTKEEIENYLKRCYPYKFVKWVVKEDDFPNQYGYRINIGLKFKLNGKVYSQSILGDTDTEFDIDYTIKRLLIGLDTKLYFLNNWIEE